MDRKGVAELLRVTVRTVKNWEQGKSRVPYSAYRLLRIHGCYDLPGEAWSGWRLSGDTLWSPERRGFRPFDLAWWGLTVAMAREWKRLYEGEISGNEVAAQLTITAGDVMPGGLLSIDKRPPLHGGVAQGGGVKRAVVSSGDSSRPQAGEPVCVVNSRSAAEGVETLSGERSEPGRSAALN